MEKLLLSAVLIAISPLSHAADFLSPQEIINKMNHGEPAVKRVLTTPAFVPLEDIISPAEQALIDQKRFRESAKGLSPEASAVVADDIQQSVDLRAFDTPIKRQFGPTCTAFGLVAAMENYLGRASPIELSERHLWSLYKQYRSRVALRHALRSPITIEELWPQSRSNPLAGYMDGAVYQLKAATDLGDDISATLRKLDQGFPVFIGLRVAEAMKCENKVVGPNSKATKGGHAVAIVGYHLDPALKSGGYFILKNSWGPRCGDNGYQYLDFNNCRRKDMYCKLWSIDKVQDNRLAVAL